MSIVISALITGLNDEISAEEKISALSTKMERAIKKALRWSSMQGRWSCLHKTDASQSVTAGTQNLTKMADFHLLDNITLNDGTYEGPPLEPLEGGFYQWLTNREHETSSSYGEPVNKVERGNNIYLEPLPDGAYTASINYWSIHQTSDLALTTVLAFPDVFESALVYAVCAAYLDTTDRHNKATLYWAKALGELDDLRDGFEDKRESVIKYQDL
jgi:hypothetical protein